MPASATRPGRWKVEAKPFEAVNGQWDPDAWNAAVRVQVAVRDALGVPLSMVAALTALAETIRAQRLPAAFLADLAGRIERGTDG